MGKKPESKESEVKPKRESPPDMPTGPSPIFSEIESGDIDPKEIPPNRMFRCATVTG